MCNTFHFFTLFLAVLAACLKSLALGLPLAPFGFMVSPEPFLILLFFALMFPYKLMGYSPAGNEAAT